MAGDSGDLLAIAAIAYLGYDWLKQNSDVYTLQSRIIEEGIKEEAEIAVPAIPTSDISMRAAEMAKSFVGIPYEWGGMSPDGFDCSGLVAYVYRKLAVGLPRVAQDQFYQLPAVGGTPQVGDLVFFNFNGTVDHVALVIDNQGGLVDANGETGVVQYDSLDAWQPWYVGFRRPTMIAEANV